MTRKSGFKSLDERQKTVRKFNGKTYRFFSAYNHSDAKKKVKDLKKEFPTIQARTVKSKRFGYAVYTRRN